MRKIFCLLGILYSQRTPWPWKTRPELWNTNKVSGFSAWKTLELWLLSRRFESAVHDGIYYSHSDFGVYNNSLDNISFSLNFREVFETRDGWFVEHRPHFNVGYKDSFGKFVLSNRFRAELRTYEIYDTSMRYRNKLEFGFKVKNLYFFVNDEIFLTHSDIPRNRNSLGMSHKATDSLKLSLSYLLQQNFKEVLILNHAVHVKFSLKI
jgi:hypothetical protein